jgi:hypothetical protein
MGHKETHALQQRESVLFDHLVSSGKQRRRHCEAEHFGGSEIDDQIELGRLKHWQRVRLRASQNLAGLGASLSISVGDTGSVAHQTTNIDVLTLRIDRGKSVTRRKRHELVTLAE